MIINLDNIIVRLSNNLKGATAIEYGLIAALVCLAIIAGLTLTGGDIGLQVNQIANAIDQ